MTRQCPECLADLPPRQPGQRGALKTFCCPDHKRAYQARLAKIGRAMASAAMAWRAARNFKDADHKATGRDALQELCRIIDGQNAEDKAEGRMPGIDYFAQMQADGRLYMDRARN